MDLKEAYVAALDHDATLRVSRAAARFGQERLPQARAQMLPNLSASIGHTRNDLDFNSPDPVTGRSRQSESRYDSNNQTVTLRQPLIRPFQWAQVRQAEAQAADASATLENDLQNVGVRVAEAYFQALQADDDLALVLAQKTSFEAELDAARKSLAAGVTTRLGIEDAQARLDMVAAQELEARQQRDHARLLLQTLVDQPVEQLAPLDLDRLQLLPPEPARVEAWLDRALQGNAELRALQAQLEAARQEVDKARSGHYPTLDATAQWSRSRSENVLNTQSRYTNVGVGVQLNVPIYAGGLVDSNVRQALAGQDRADASLEALRRDLQLRVHQAYRSVTESILRARALEQSVRAAEHLVKSAQRAFEGGSQTRLDVLDAEQRRMGVLRDLARARYVCLLSGIRLQALAGGDRDAAIDAVNASLKR
jgi:TolC family type I secretion outer membrane protein